MDVHDYLEQVRDRDTFIAFVEALAAEREEAEKLERERPDYYQLGGALNWQNADISSFLYACLACFDDRPYQKGVSEEPSWRGFAEFLYFGKIYE